VSDSKGVEDSRWPLTAHPAGRRRVGHGGPSVMKKVNIQKHCESIKNEHIQHFFQYIVLKHSGNDKNRKSLATR
jgi:hypothetical protein